MKTNKLIKLLICLTSTYITLHAATTLNTPPSFNVLPIFRSMDYFFNSNQSGKGSGGHSILFTGTPIYSGQSISQMEDHLISLDQNGNYFIHFISHALPKSNKHIIMKVNGIPIATTVCDEKNKLSLQRIIEVTTAPVHLEFVGEDEPIHLQSRDSAFISVIRLS